jgi:hypothetical protein
MDCRGGGGVGCAGLGDAAGLDGGEDPEESGETAPCRSGGVGCEGFGDVVDLGGGVAAGERGETACRKGGDVGGCGGAGDTAGEDCVRGRCCCCCN